MHRVRVWSVLFLVFGWGCDGEPTDPDAGADAGPVIDDGGPPADGGRDAGPDDDDAGAPDGGPALCGGEVCGADETCVRDVCLADCGGDPSAFDGALAAGLTPIANFCRTAAVFGVHEDTAWDVTAATGDVTTMFTLSTWPLDPAMTPPSPTAVATATHTVGAATTLVFPGGYLEASPDGARLLFGYTTTDVDPTGGVFVVDTSGSTATVTELSAPGNFDAAWLDTDTFVVNGLGLAAEDAGQGLYVGDVSGSVPTAAHAVTGPGEYSGSVGATADYVVAGGSDSSFAGVLRVFDRADFDAAIAGTALDASADGFAVSDPASTFTMLSPTRVLSTPFGGPLTASDATWSDATGLTLSSPEALATGDTFTDAMPAEAGRLVFVHAGGLLLVQE